MRSSQQYGSHAEQEEDVEGETSGYASDSGGTPNDRNDMWNQHHQDRHHSQDYWMSDNQRDDRMSRKFNKQTPWVPSNR